jgi:hypothetical protein
MSTMESPTVISLDVRRDRGRRMARAIDMRRGLETSSERRKRGRRRGGRAWVNGRELGGTRDSLAHLGATHD